VFDQTTQYLRIVPCTVIPDGFDPGPKPLLARDEFNAEFNLPRDARVIACIGRVQRRKGQLDLLEAFGELAARHPDAVLLICGDTGDTEFVAQIKNRISDLGLESRVMLPGFRDDVASLIRYCELVVHPAHSEGFGLAVLEAMAAGKPVIATRSGGPEEIIEDGVSGLLVPPATPTLLGEAMERVLADIEFAKSIANAARIRAAKFTTAESARQFELLMQDTLSAGVAKVPRIDRANQICRRVLDEIKIVAQ